MFNHPFRSPRTTHVDHFVARALPRRTPRRFAVLTKALPAYSFVDVHRAIEAYCQAESEDAAATKLTTLDTAHPYFTLANILQGQTHDRRQFRIGPADRAAWPVALDEEVFLPIDNFWILTPSDRQMPALVIRLQYKAYESQSFLEIASDDSEAAQQELDWIIERHRSHSVYRGAIIHLNFETGARDEYGDVEKQQQLRIMFANHRPVTSDDLIVEDTLLKLMKRNVLDLHDNRALLRANHVPTHRGVLLYGPPGTGKTYSCRYLCSHLSGTTRIFITGSALTQVGAIFSLARALQPAVLFLEDVDLVFASREINLYSTALGDLLDHMDGLRSGDDITVVFTTNAIDRMEAAIKDRPGRISQLIFMGPPHAGLRERYLKRYLEPHTHDAVDIAKIVEMSDGATQAFLKEWIHRAVQIACERIALSQADAATSLPSIILETADFEVAMKEMTLFTDEHGRGIVGFIARQ